MAARLPCPHDAGALIAGPLPPGSFRLGQAFVGPARQAVRVGELLHGRPFGLVLVSPLSRARETCELAGYLDQAEVTDDLVEWDYGAYEGRTTTEIRESTGDPDWSVWTTAEGLGESAADVALRAERVLTRCRPLLHAGEDVVLVAHAHLLRILI